MRKIILVTYTMLISGIVFSQVGINTQNPASTLDVAYKPEDLFAAGVTAPRLTGDEIKLANQQYGAAQKGTLIYATQAASPSSPPDKTQNIITEGYYYFDGTLWIPASGLALNGLHKDGTSIKLGGAIIEPTSITGLTAANKIIITGTGKDMMTIRHPSFLAPAFSVDGTQKRIGLATNSPLQTLDIGGTARLSQTNTGNRPSQLVESAVPLYVSRNTGQIVYAPKGYSSVNGGYRPGSNYLITTLPVNNTITTIRFVCYIDASNDAINSNNKGYTYGDFTIIGNGTANPVKIVQKDIRGYDGQPKVLSSDTATGFSWDMSPQGTGNIIVNQTTGQVTFTKTVDTYPYMSYFFEVLGGT